MHERQAIIIDADVISHFISGGKMLFLNKIFDLEILILDKVLHELQRFRSRRVEVENLIRFNIVRELPFPEDDIHVKREFFRLKSEEFLGEGESACLAYIRYNGGILASSNLKDVKRYCNEHSIVNLTTMDFLCEALRKGVFARDACNEFISRVLANGSKLPVREIDDFDCRPVNFK